MDANSLSILLHLECLLILPNSGKFEVLEHTAVHNLCMTSCANGSSGPTCTGMIVQHKTLQLKIGRGELLRCTFVKITM